MSARSRSPVAGRRSSVTGHRSPVAVLCICAALLGATCDSTDPLPDPDPDPIPSAGACAVAPAGPPGPVGDPNGPFHHQVATAHTTDGRTLTAHRQILDHASVPDGVQRTDGTVLIYYVNGADGAVFVARLLDDTAQVLGPLVLNGVSRPAGVVDPDAYLAPDGKVRLAYFAGFGTPGASTVRAMCLAESVDGLSFTVLGPALGIAAGETLTDPSVVRLANGTWRMAISRGQRTVLASSADGLVFHRYDEVPFGGVPELAIAPDGRLRLYVCAGGIFSWISPDGGTVWDPEGVVVPPGTLGHNLICDPSLVAGANLFVFKTAN